MSRDTRRVRTAENFTLSKEMYKYGPTIVDGLTVIPSMLILTLNFGIIFHNQRIRLYEH